MKSIPDSKQLSDMAHKEWKNREEHRGIHDESDWCSGWISGYLSANIPSRGFKIVESVPDKNNILIIAIKEDPYGPFISREAALKYIVKENQLKDLHEHVEALCDEIGRIGDWQSKLGFNALLIKRKIESLRKEDAS